MVPYQIALLQYVNNFDVTQKIILTFDLHKKVPCVIQLNLCNDSFIDVNSEMITILIFKF